MKMLKTFAATSLLLLFSATPFLFPTRAAAQNTQNFTIQSFDADYYVGRTDKQASSMQVKETIVAEFPSYDQNHGILRAIPETYQDHTVSLDIQGVTDGQNNWHYTTSRQNDNTVLKIGDANTYVHGKQTYVISYSMRNVMGLYDDHDELYWDANGTEWQQPFGSVTARIHLPESLASSFNGQLKCFSGNAGSKEPGSCIIGQQPEAGGVVITAEARNLDPQQTLTFVAGFNKGTFVLGPEIAQAKRQQTIKALAITGAIILPPIIAFVLLLRRWRKYGNDPKGRGVIIPEYVPPKGFNALRSEFLLHENLSGKSVTAEIIALAVAGYITIYETTKKKILKDQKEYELELNKTAEGLSAEQQEVVTALFGSVSATGSRIKLSSLKNKLYATVTSVTKDLGIKMADEGYFVSNPKKAGATYVAVGIGLIILGFVLVSVFVGIGLILMGIITLIFGWIMPARTARGVELRDYLLGLKQYISVAEKDRIQFLQSPEGAEKIEASGLDPRDPAQKVKLFESLLPYAMLFGLEKQWAKQFEGLYSTPPNWYRGNWTTFNAVYLASSLGGFSSVSSASFSAPSSSSSSGFGGGGFSGGGGGGGGGGGW